MNRPIFERNQQQTIMDAWFDDSDTWVGVFENHDLGHPQIGMRCAFPFARADGSFDRAEVGKTTAPDGRSIGLGWRYVLAAKCSTAAEALAELRKGEN